mgnify:CR=1 FL=1
MRLIVGSLCLFLCLTAWIPGLGAQGLDLGAIEEKSARHGFAWDAQLEGGYAPLGEPAWDPALFGRLRLGGLWVHEPWYFAAGAIVTTGGLGEWAGGAQLELTHLWTGFWGQLSLEGNDRSQLQAGLGFGWSIVGIEYMQSPHATEDWLFVAKLRIPIGIAIFGFNH